MKIRIEDAYSYVIDPTPEEIMLLRKICSITEIQHLKTRFEAHPRKIKVQRRFYRNGKIPTGLLTRFVAAGVCFDIDDTRKVPVRSSEAVFDWKLSLPIPKLSESDYSFQEDAVFAALEYQRGLLHYPTGSGKTIIMAKIISALRLNTILIVPNLELMYQTTRKFMEYFSDGMVGYYGEGNYDGLNYPISICTEQSLYSLMKKDLDKFRSVVAGNPVLMLDECHHVNIASKSRGKDKARVANTWWEVAQNIPAYYRFGLSATLSVADDVNNQFVLESATGKIIASITEGELIDRKVLCPLHTTMIRLSAEPQKVWKTWKGVPGAYDVNIIDNEYRNKLICRLAEKLQRQGKKVLVLVDLVERQGKILKDQIDPSVFLYGKHNRLDRDNGIVKFIEENVILISTIVKEGFDVPEIDVVIIAGGGKAHKALKQKIGRARRVFPGKNFAEIYDFFDDDGYSTFGPRMCTKHSLERQYIYESVEQDKLQIVSVEWIEKQLG